MNNIELIEWSYLVVIFIKYTRSVDLNNVVALSHSSFVSCASLFHLFQQMMTFFVTQVEAVTVLILSQVAQSWHGDHLRGERKWNENEIENDITKL